MNACTIAVDASGAQPVFAFRADGAVRIMQLNLWRDGVDSPLWAIAVDNPPGQTIVEPEGHGGSEEAILRAVFESIAKDIAAGVGSLPVATITYGEVPPGFKQQYPRSGPAPKLEPGPHSLAVSGGSTGWLSFVVPDGG